MWQRDFTVGDPFEQLYGPGLRLAVINQQHGLGILPEPEPIYVTLAQSYDVALSLRIWVTSDALSLSLRHNPGIGAYTVTVTANGQITLARAGVVVASAQMPSPPMGQQLRLSAADHIVRVNLDGSDVITFADDAPLPPGLLTLQGSGFVDDMQIWQPAPMMQLAFAPAFVGSSSAQRLAPYLQDEERLIYKHDTFTVAYQGSTEGDGDLLDLPHFIGSDAVVSPDGRLVAYTCWYPSLPQNICLTDLTGPSGNFTPVTNLTGLFDTYAYAPNWSADGRLSFSIHGGCYTPPEEPGYCDPTVTIVHAVNPTDFFVGTLPCIDTVWAGTTAICDTAGGIQAFDGITGVWRETLFPSSYTSIPAVQPLIDGDGILNGYLVAFRDRLQFPPIVMGLRTVQLDQDAYFDQELGSVSAEQFDGDCDDISPIDFMGGAEILLVKCNFGLTSEPRLMNPWTLQEFDDGQDYSGLEVYSVAAALQALIYMPATATAEALLTATAEAQATATAQAQLATEATATAAAEATATAQAQCLISPPVGLNFALQGGLLTHDGISGLGGRPTHPLEHVGADPTLMYLEVAGAIPSRRRTYSSYWDQLRTPIYSNTVVSQALDLGLPSPVGWSQTARPLERIRIDLTWAITLQQTGDVIVTLPSGLNQTFTFTNTTGYGFTRDVTGRAIAIGSLPGARIILVCNPGFAGGLNYTVITSYPN